MLKIKIKKSFESTSKKITIHYNTLARVDDQPTWRKSMPCQQGEARCPPWTQAAWRQSEALVGGKGINSQNQRLHDLRGR